MCNELVEVKAPLDILREESNELTEKVVAETDPDKFKDLKALFQMNQDKKNMLRADRLSSLLERVDYEVIARFESEPESFDNDQLVKYMDSTQKAINSITQSINQTPQIQINTQNNDINITAPELDVDSRKRVLETVLSILNSNAVDADYGIVEEEICEET